MNNFQNISQKKGKEEGKRRREKNQKKLTKIEK
jgi:hypothetical protein